MRLQILLLFFFSASSMRTLAQDNCSSAFALCNGQSIVRSTTGASPSPSTDPVLNCGDGTIQNNVWFQFTALATGSVNVTVTGINNTPGLSMEIYSGSCGSLTTTGFCTTGSGAGGGSMSLFLPVTQGTTYFVMIDGESGNQETFTITASSTQSLTGLPVPDFNPVPSSGCAPFTTLIQNTTSLQGGTNIRYEWRIDNGAFLPASGADTNLTFNTVGVHTVQLRVCNQECGCVSITKDILAQDLITGISYNPAVACIGSTINFDGIASIEPDPPFTDPDVTDWQWYFDDPASGTANTANGQTVSHTFVGPQTLFNVRLVVFGLCGPDTVTQLIDLNPKPNLQVTSPVIVCEGSDATVTVNVQGASAPYSYSWTGTAGSIQCSTCSSTVVTGLVPTGPYAFDVSVTDAQGCTADTTVNVSVNPQPELDIDDTLTVCRGTNATLIPAIITGVAPLNFSWTPSTGLNSSSTQNPVASVNSDITYCVTATDAAGCSSDPVCIFLDVPVPPDVSPAVQTVCASDPNPQNTFVVNGASPGSSITWSTSPDFNLISSAASDSSFITVTFPQGVAGSYSFTAIVEDFITGCIDTLPVSFTVSNLNNLTVNTPAPICEGGSALLTASGSTNYNWTSVPIYTFTNPSAANQTVSPVVTTTFIVTGTTGTCTAVDTVTLEVHPIPVVTPFTPWQICEGSTISIITTLTQGIPPLTFSWTPSTGLIGPTTQNPTATPTAPITYCVTATDSIGCSSDPECISITFYDPPTITPAVSVVCASDPNPQNTFTLDGASPGSTITWASSPDYGLIVSSPIDSSFITVNFPPNNAGTYSFTAIVEDFTTGCIDTVSTTFAVTNPNNLAISGPSAVCEGTTVNLSVSGAASYNWSSNPAITFNNPQQANQSVALTATTDFYVTGTTGSCSRTDTFTVAVNPLPVVLVTPPAPSCGCDTLVLTGSTTSGAPSYSWNAANGSPLTNPNAPATIGYGCNGDAFTLTVTDLLTGCSADSVVTAIGRPSPNVIATVSPAIICPGNPTQISLSGNGSDTTGNSVSWTSNSLIVAIDDTSALNTTATVSGLTVFTLTISDGFGCDSSATDTVFVQPEPQTTANTPFLCTSDAVLQSTISVSGAAVNATYNWTTVPGCVTPSNPTGSSSTFDFSGCGTGIFTFNLTVSDPATGCVSNLTETVEVTTGVTLSLDNDTVTICEGSDATFIAGGANSYLWSNGATTDTVTFSGLTALGSPYAYTVTGTIGSCSTSSSVLVLVDPVDQFGPIQGPLVACSNDSSIQYSIGTPGNNYVWSVSGGQIISGQGTDTINVYWGLGLSGTVTITDTSTTGCPGQPQSLQVTISQSPAVLPLVAGNREVCDSTVETYTVFGANPGSTFTWTVGNGQIIGSNTGPSIDVQWPDSGSGTVSVYETNSAGCTGPIRTEFININDIPVIPVITGQQTVCQGSSESYAINLNQGSGYVWTIDSGTVISYSADNDTVFVSWPNPVQGSVSVVETNSFGCSSDPAVFQVTVSPLPTVDILGDSIATCQNTTLNLSSIAPFGILNWTTSGTGTFSDPAVNAPTYDVGATDIGQINLELSAATPGCPTAYDSIRIYLQPVPQIATSVSSDTICYASSDTIAVSGADTYTYSWSDPQSNDSTLIVSPQTTTTYTVTASSSFGCTSTSTITVHVIPPGIPDAGGDIIACLGDVVQLSGSQTNALGLIWTTGGDGTFSPADTASSIAYTPGTIDTTSRSNWIYLTTTGACYNQTDSILITYAGIPSVYAGPDTMLTSGFTSNVSIALQPAVTNVGGVVWSTSGSGFFDPSDTSLNASYVPSADDFGLDSIIITLISTGGCQTASDEFIIEISPFIIPNIFTPFPASPGQNDFFVINGLPESSRLRIYDRWGVLVFESTDYRNNWDAANLAAETFYYVLNSRGREFHGWIRVMRDE